MKKNQDGIMPEPEATQLNLLQGGKVWGALPEAMC